MNSFRSHSCTQLFFLTGLSLFFLTMASLAPVHGESFEKALVKKAINEVFIHPDITAEKTDPRPARPGKDILKGNMGLETEQESRSELVFKDESVARVGSNALFTFTEEARELQLGRGVMLLQVPKNSEETNIKTTTVTAALTGTTVFVEQQPNNYVKFIVMEGSSTVSIPDRIGEQVSLTAGEMIAMSTDAERIPEPVNVNLERLANTSGLIQELEDGEDEVSFNPEQYTGAIQNQNEELEEGELQSTDLTIQGEGLEVLYDPEVESEEESLSRSFQEQSRDERSTTDAEETSDATEETNDSTEELTPSDDVLPLHETTVQVDDNSELTLGALNLDQFPPTLTTDGTSYDGRIYSRDFLDQTPSEWYAFDSQSSVTDLDNFQNFNSSFRTVTGDRNVASFKFNGLDLTGSPTINTSSDGPSDLALISADPSLDLDATADASFSNLDSLTLLNAGGSGGNLLVSGDPLSKDGADLGLFSVDGDLSVDNVSLPASESDDPTQMIARAGGSITTSNSVQANKIDYRSGNGITVQNSTELKALAHSDGTSMSLLARNGDINVNGTLATEDGSISLAQSNGGKILLDNDNLLDTSETTDTFKAKVTGSGGVIEVTEGTRLDADETLELLASQNGSSGSIEFTGGNDIYLSGDATKVLKADDINVSGSLDVETSGGDLKIWVNDREDFSLNDWDTEEGDAGGSGGDFDAIDDDMTVTVRELDSGDIYE